MILYAQPLSKETSMKCGFIGGTILLVSSMLAAQSTTKSADPSARQPASASLPVSASASTCPVSLHALQGSGTGLLAVSKAESTSGPAQHIHLILSNGNTSRPVSGKVVVRGLAGKSQLLQTQSSEAERFDLIRSLDIPFTPQGEREVAADLTLAGFTSVSSIHLESIDYADGSTWKIASGQVCRVVPDPIMLVAGR